MISQDSIIRVVESLTQPSTGLEVVGSLGTYGGCRLNSDATIQNQTGNNISFVPDSGGAAGTYRAYLSAPANCQIQSIDWFEVKGFTPRTPTGVETADARVCGYNIDTANGQWYITIQVVLLSSGAVTATPPAGFVIGVRAACTLSVIPGQNLL